MYMDFSQVPLLQEVRSVTLAEDGNFALLSYEDRAPPQVWRVEMIDKDQKYRLSLAHIYFTEDFIDCAGRGHFGGVNDMFVLCASKGDKIHIWERASGMLLHSLKVPGGELTSIAWNHRSPNGFTIASATQNGEVQIWTTTTTSPISSAS
ncbi:hypothetical protein BDV93DRAFT_572831 [Ceratobasidium sp. AG-I]|nr:hypothetical protein BDV93DRAFT_572831 [Ceratobasidium sp. AG-I]